MVTRIAMISALIFAAVGCATKTYTPILQYMVNPAIEVDSAAITDRSLGVRPLESSRPSQRRMAYTSDGHTLHHYPSAEWADVPRDVVTQAIVDALVAGGRFADVGSATDMRRPDYILTGQLRAFHEDRSSGTPQAICSVRIEVRESGTGEALWANTLTARAALASSTPADLAAAMDDTVAEIVETAATALAGL
jgi:ABC-type uncharacterized transport system auxiliary subunit